MRYVHLAQRLYNCPLLITPEKAHAIEAIFRARVEGRAALESPTGDAAVPKQEMIALELAAQGMQRADAGYWRTTDGVALIPIIGTLVQRADSLDAMSGLIGYNRIANQLQAALDDPRVDAILLEIDSPGGEANGLADLTSKVAAAAKKKPTWAFANEMAFSAAYWLATAADRIYTPQTGMVGSIGVYMMHQDQSVKDAKAGITYTPIQYGKHKTALSPHAPLSDEARAMAQSRVDEMGDLFVATVASNRGVDEQAVRDTEAALLNTTAALDLNLIDGVASFDETLTALGAEAQKYRMRGGRMAAQLSASAEERLDIMAQQDNTAATAAQIAEAEARGAAKAKAEAETDAAKKLTDAQAAAGKAAQERISSILTHAEAAGRKTLAEHLAFKTAQSVDDAVAMLAAAPKEAAAAPANLLAAAMSKVTNPNVGADGDVDDKSKVTAPNAANIYAFRRECVAKARAGVK